jgi:response regulator RpfG family c-di-GMP phosphodiesterase
VHEVTKLVLNSFSFEGRRLRFFHAYSGAEARKVLLETPEIAVILLDVVMEEETAGLDVVKFIRLECKNTFSRIVLRTGQPGQAPEQDVIANFDINDYKDKTELTSQKLYTMMFATLRAYRDVMIIENQKRGLERVIEASSKIFSFQQSNEFASAVLDQLTNLLGMRKGALYCKVRDVGNATPDHFVVAAANGDYRSLLNHNADEGLPAHIVQSLKQAFAAKQSLFKPDHYVLFFTDSHQSESLLYVGENWHLNELEHRLVEIFCTNVSIAFENLHLNKELFDAQLEMVYLLAGAAETRSRETANHVRRVGLYAELLGRSYGVGEAECAQLKFAAPLHDIGKIGIPDQILNKPGPHSETEMRTMRTHADLGAQMLQTSKRPLMRLAAQIASEHHENWDGSGYPRGLKGKEISLAGRITSLADVFDALGSDRCYKQAWSDDEIKSFIRAQSGVKFEPRLVELLHERFDELKAIRDVLPD